MSKGSTNGSKRDPNKQAFYISSGALVVSFVSVFVAIQSPKWAYELEHQPADLAVLSPEQDSINNVFFDIRNDGGKPASIRRGVIELMDVIHVLGSQIFLTSSEGPIQVDFNLALSGIQQRTFSDRQSEIIKPGEVRRVDFNILPYLTNSLPAGVFVSNDTGFAVCKVAIGFEYESGTEIGEPIWIMLRHEKGVRLSTVSNIEEIKTKVPESDLSRSPVLSDFMKRWSE